MFVLVMGYACLIMMKVIKQFLLCLEEFGVVGDELFMLDDHAL